MARPRKARTEPAPPAQPAMAAGVFKSPLSGYFATSPSKTLSILPDQPLEGWVALSFTDANDEFALSNQVMYVPRDHFDAALKQYLGAHPIEV